MPRFLECQQALIDFVCPSFLMNFVSALTFLNSIQHQYQQKMNPIKQEGKIQLDSYRYVNWILFILAAFINSIPTQAFSGISPTITKVYEISQFEATIPSIIYPVSYIFLLLPANYILDKKGLKLGTLICQMFMILGLLVRILINVHYYLFCLGTFLCSLGFCFMISGATKFANLWFPQKQIFLANALCVFAIFGSDALGTFLSSYFIRQDTTKDQVFNFFLWESTIMIVIQMAMAIFFRDRPKNIQNFASNVTRNNFSEDLRNILKNKNYIVIFCAITFVFGDLSIIFVFTPWITKTYGYQTISNGIIIACSNLVGCLGCVLVSVIAKSVTYRKKCIVLIIGLIVGNFLLWGSFEINQPILSYMAGGISGFFAYPLLTTATDFATQTSFPVGEATAGGLLLFGGQLMGVILTIIFSQFFDGESLELTRILIIIIIVLFIIGFVFLLFTQQILKRDEYQDQKIKENSQYLINESEQ